MALSKRQVEELLRLVGRTSESELDCGGCLSLLAEFAEQSLEGKTIPAGLEVVVQHLSVCSECCEEFELLKRALQELDH